MLIQKFHDQLQLLLRNKSGVISLLYVCSVLLMLLVFLLSMSIRMTDTDLWYHLTGGRFLFETGQLANPLDKSFIEPRREFLNYFWGFQAIAFSIWDVSGYLGMIVTKASLTLGTAWFLAKIVVMDKRFSQAGFWQLVLLSLIVFLLSTRFSFRPHVFSYFFTAFFIYTLMYRGKWFRILPLATILWVNIHGVEWVIGGLICGSYVLQRSFAYMKNRDIQSLRSSLWVVACLPAVLVNPEGIYLFLAPFITPSGVYEFVSELTKLQFATSISFAPGLTTDNVFLLLFPLGIFSLIQAGRQFEQYIFTILLAVGGLFYCHAGHVSSGSDCCSRRPCLRWVFN
ncbi:MAG: hypothetical protein ABGY96_18690 [bacterium]|nr:hypothetical protein [Gammaproteobacteria bacterium]HIL98845.1 hypothetical protein [Pseudomonadales bacterium]